jgi:hypothetical protein
MAAIGFRVKSGWATAVLVAGPVQAPRILDRRAIDLCDPAIPESRQPHHAGMSTLQTDATKVERLRKIVIRAANQSVADLIKDYQTAGHQIGAAGLVVGSEIDPAKVSNPHIRAHALEGRLFRTALEEALRSCGLACSILVERNAYSRAAEILKKSPDALKRSVASLGRSVGGPWRADEKTATLAAWLLLCDYEADSRFRALEGHHRS